MKWIKVAIGVVIAVTMVGIIVKSVHSMTQESVKNEVVTFKLLEDQELAVNVYDKISEYGIFDNNAVTNLVNITVNDVVNTNLGVYYFNDNDNYLIGDGNDFEIEIYDISYVLYDGFIVGDTIAITFEITQAPRLTGIIATLLLLTPLIFAGSVLAFMLNKQEF